MRGRLALALVTVLTAQDPAGFVKAGQAGTKLLLEVRVFDGAEEVTTHTRLTVHKAGDRSEALPHLSTGDGRLQLEVPPGIYDAQAIHVRAGRVLNIRWANRLVVMPYPDEQGHHLEVINFKNGYGALQVRRPAGGTFDAAIYEAGKREKPAGISYSGRQYLLFIVPAGVYDLEVRTSGSTNWQSGLEVPLDRTRLSIVP